MIVVSLLGIASVGFWRGEVLRTLAGPLAIDQGWEHAGWICITTEDDIRPAGDGWWDAAARFCREDARRRVLVVERRPERLVELGVVPPLAAIVRRELGKRGLGETVVSAFPAAARDDWDEARAIGRWLEEHRDVQLACLCSRFDGRRRRLIFDRLLAAELAARVRVVALRDRHWDQPDWWRERSRAAEVASALLQLTYVWAAGCPTETEERWNPVDYQRDLRAIAGQAAAPP